jgi:hypothetical protein
MRCNRARLPWATANSSSTKTSKCRQGCVLLRFRRRFGGSLSISSGSCLGTYSGSWITPAVGGSVGVLDAMPSRR